MSGRSESRSETPRSENQQDESDKQENNNTEQVSNNEDNRPPVSNDGPSPSEGLPQSGWGAPPKWEINVKQSGPSWGDPHSAEPVHNKSSWSQPSQPTPDSWSIPSQSGWGQSPSQSQPPPGQSNQPKNGWNQPPTQPQQNNQPPPTNRPSQTSSSNWANTPPNSAPTWTDSNKPIPTHSDSRGPAGDQNGAWNSSNPSNPPPSSQSGTDWNRPTEHGSNMDAPTSQGDNRYNSYPQTTMESINKMHTNYAIDHNLDEATQKLINSNDGWGKKPITQSTKWNLEEGNQQLAGSASRSTTGQNGTEWWSAKENQSGSVGGPGDTSSSGGRKEQHWRDPPQKPDQNNWPHNPGQVTNRNKPWPEQNNQQRPTWDQQQPPSWHPSGPHSRPGYPEQPPPNYPPAPRPGYPGRGGYQPEPSFGPNGGWPGPGSGPGWQNGGSNYPGYGTRRSPSHQGPPGGRWDHDKPDWSDQHSWNPGQRPIWNQPERDGWDKPERNPRYPSHWDDPDPSRLGYPNNMPPQFNTSHINMQNINILKMAIDKGLMPSSINVNDPTYSSNQQLVHVCRSLLPEIEKKNRIQMELQQAYRGSRGGPNQPWNPVSHAQIQTLQQQLEASTSAEQHLRQNLQQTISSLWNKSREPNQGLGNRHPGGFGGHHQPGRGQDHNFGPPNPDRNNPSWDKKEKDVDQLTNPMESLQLKGADKLIGDTGPPPFVPGQAWKGPVDHKAENLDPYKNPDLTPAMFHNATQSREKGSHDSRGGQMSQNPGWNSNQHLQSSSGHPDRSQGWPQSHQPWPQQQNPGWPNPSSDSIDRPSPNNPIPPNLLPADIFDNNQ